MAKDIKELLGLAGYEVVSISEDEDEVVVGVELVAEDACPHCGVFSTRVHQRTAKPSRVLFGFIGQRRLVLLVRRQRLFCGDCRRAFTQRLPGVPRRQRVGVEAGATLLRWLAEQSFSWVNRTFGVGYWRMRRILMRLPLPWCDLESFAGDEGPICLGIDEHSFRGTDLVITITLLAPRRQLLAILPDDRQLTLRTFLKELSPAIKGRIVAVCIDLKESYRAVLRQELPDAEVVVDHFHVIADANRRLDDTRRLEQNEGKVVIKRWPLLKRPNRLSAKQRLQLDEIEKTFPTLKEHYWIKERLRELYAAGSAAEAVQLWSSLLIVMEASDDAAVGLWAKTLRKWRTEILAYHRRRITNGFTEGCHTKIKLLKRVSYGYRNRTVYRAKMLLGFLPTTSAALTPHLST